MTIDRVGTSVQAQYLLEQVTNASTALNTSQAQVASGKLASDYTGYGDKVAALEAARAAAARAETYKSATQTAVDRANLQDNQLSTLSDLAGQLRQAVTTAVADNDGSTLMSKVQNIFDQAVQVLNSKDANGNYLFGGDKDNIAPVSVSTLAGLGSAASAASVFANGSVASSVTVADGVNVTVGVLASNAGTQLLQSIKDIVGFNSGGSGPFTTGLTGAQSNFLSAEIPVTITAGQNVNTAAAQNGDVYNRLKDAVTHQDTLSTLYQGFTSDIEDVDMGKAIANLNQNQAALQAALKVTAQLNQISLLDYMK